MQQTRDKVGAEATESAPQPMFTEAQTRKLRIAVVVMGVVLLVGFAIVIGRLVYLLNRPAINSAHSQQSGSLASPSGPNAHITVPEGAVVRHISLSGNRLAIHIELSGASTIEIIDLATGKSVQQIDLKPDKKRSR